MSEELCVEGQRLWEAIDYHEQNSWNAYRKHLLKCKHCQKALDIREEDLENIKDDVEGKL